MPMIAGGGRFAHSTQRGNAKEDGGSSIGSDVINRFRDDLIDEADAAEEEAKAAKVAAATKKKRLAAFKSGLKRKHSVLHGVDSAYIKYGEGEGGVQSNATFGGMSDLLQEFEEVDREDEALAVEEARRHEVRAGPGARQDLPCHAMPGRATPRRAAPRRAGAPVDRGLASLGSRVPLPSSARPWLAVHHPHRPTLDQANTHHFRCAPAAEAGRDRRTESRRPRMW